MATIKEWQSEYWKAQGASTWAPLTDRIDAMNAPATRYLVDLADVRAGDSILDIGCGAGQSSRALADAAGEDGRVVGADLSEDLLDVAREKAGPTERYVMADGETHDFGENLFDRVTSQFGVMFFQDTVAAFANLRRATAQGGRITLCTWGPREQNPYFGRAHAVAASVLGDEPGDPDGPGPMRLRDIGATVGKLAAAGWANAEGRAVAMKLTPPGTVSDVADFLMRLGPAAMLLRVKKADADAASRVRDGLVEVLRDYDTGEGVSIPAELNFYTAVAV